MAEFSRPQPGLHPADGDDCGAYTAAEWAPVLIAGNRASGMMVTGAAAPPGLPATQLFPNVGVYYSVADRLAVSSPGASQITIGTGASLVDGRLHTNDTEHTAVAITNPAANPRIDRVVVRQNYGAVDYTSVNAPALVVDFNTARICIISGAENVAPVAPTLTQDEDRTTYWDIPLAQYQISVAGVITGLTDEREWVDAETKSVFIPAITGDDVVTGQLVYTADYGWQLQDGNTSYMIGWWQVPLDFLDDLTITSIISPDGTGNIYSRQWLTWGECGTALNTHTATPAYAQTAVTNGFVECINEASVTPVVVGDIFTIRLYRGGGDVLDTVNADVFGLGFVAEYLGWGRR